MSRSYAITLSRKKLVAVGTAAMLLVTGSAYGISVDNTPANGYLLCSNIKTHAVIFPNKLSCPSGYSSLQLGAQGPAGQDGADGQDGAQGPAGPAGSSSEWIYNIAPRDVVGPTSVTTWSGLKRFIFADISKSNLSGGGSYNIRASISGQWATSSPTNSYLDCYFQQAKNYPSGSQYFGEADTSYTTWTGIALNVFGETSDYALGQGDVYLVCNMDGSISGLNGYLSVTSVQSQTGLNLNPPPSN